jgi:hypothetical protein
MSATNTECLKYVVGLSDADCPCFPEAPETANKSESGLYISEYVDMRLFSSGCQSGNIWDQLDKARTTGINRLKFDLMACITSNKSTKLSRTPFSGIVGDAQKYSQNIAPLGTYQAMSFIPANILSGYMKIKRIGLYMSLTTSFDVWLYSNYQDTPIAGWNIPSTSNKLQWSTIDLPTLLPLSVDGFNYVQYWFVYEPAGSSFKDIKLDCGCDRVFPPWDIANPDYPIHPRFPWNEWIMARGMFGDSLSNMADWETSELTMGMLLDVSFGCKTDEIICKDNLDFDSNYLARAIALAIQHKSAQTAFYNALTFGNAGGFDNEMLYNKMQFHQNKYNELLEYLCQEITKPENLNRSNDCFMCSNENSFVLGGILA